MQPQSILGGLSDDELIRCLGDLVTQSRRVEADLVAHIGEVDRRRLYAREASPSMFVYCTERLHLSEAEAYLRISVARAGATGEAMRGLCPGGVPPFRPTRRAVVESLSPARYRVQFTASAELHDKLLRLSALMRSEAPRLDLAAVIERAVSETLERLEARRYAQTAAPRKQPSDAGTSSVSRHVPAAVRRAVVERDGGRCAYVDSQGRRCSERERLEFHHRHPFGVGGDHRPRNIGLLCRAHNRLLAEGDYGTAAVGPHRRTQGQRRPWPAKDLSPPASGQSARVEASSRGPRPDVV